MLTGVIRDKRGYMRPGLQGLGDNRDGETNSNTGQAFSKWAGLAPWVQPQVGTIDPLSCKPMTQQDIDSVRQSGIMTWVPNTYYINKCPGTIPNNPSGVYPGWQLIRTSQALYDNNPQAYGHANAIDAPTNSNDSRMAYDNSLGKAKQIMESTTNNGMPGGRYASLFDDNHVNDRNMLLLQRGRSTLQQQAEAAGAIIVLQGGSAQDVLSAMIDAFKLSNAASDGIDTRVDYLAKLKDVAAGYTGPMITSSYGEVAQYPYRGRPNAAGIYDNVSVLALDRPGFLFSNFTQQEIDSNDQKLSSSSNQAVAAAANQAIANRVVSTSPVAPATSPVPVGASAVQITYPSLPPIPVAARAVALPSPAPVYSSATDVATFDPVAPANQLVYANRVVSQDPVSSIMPRLQAGSTRTMVAGAQASPVAASSTDQAMNWIEANPLLTAAIAAGVLLFLGRGK